MADQPEQDLDAKGAAEYAAERLRRPFVRGYAALGDRVTKALGLKNLTPTSTYAPEPFKEGVDGSGRGAIVISGDDDAGKYQSVVLNVEARKGSSGIETIIRPSEEGDVVPAAVVASWPNSQVDPKGSKNEFIKKKIIARPGQGILGR